MTWETWRWDESLFAGAAPFYVQGRLPYAPGLADAMADALALDGTGRLLDVGCGPGVVALRLAHLFEDVVGLDPDLGMLIEAAKLAAQQGVANATWVQRRAEQLPADIGAVRVATFAASFHWMDRPVVAAAVREMLEPNGAAVQVDAPSNRFNGGAAYETVVEDLRRRYLGPDRRAGQSVRNTSPSGEDAVFQAAGFRPMEQLTVTDGRRVERTIDDIVATVFSSSSTAPHLLGDRIEQFEADLRTQLAAASPTGVFPVTLPDNIVSIWRL